MEIKASLMDSHVLHGFNLAVHANISWPGSPSIAVIPR